MDFAPSPCRALRLCVTYILVLGMFAACFMPVVQAQMLPRARYKGEKLPVWKLNSHGVYVKTPKDGVMAASDIEIEPGSSFGDGSVEVLNSKSEAVELKDSNDHAMGVHYQAELTSPAEVPDCFAVLVFVVDGSIGTHWIPVGTLHPGTPRKIEAEIPGRIEVLGRLHLFSQGQELRSGETKEPYDVQAYMAGLRARSKGLSALDLCKTNRGFSLRLSPDGKRLAVARDCDTHYSLTVIDLDAMKVLCDVAVGEYTDVVRDLRWVAEEEVCFICTDKLMMLDVAKQSTRILREDMLKIWGVVLGHPDTLVLYGKNRLGSWTDRFNVHTKKDAGFEPPFTGITYADPDGIPRLRISMESDKLEFLCRPAPDSRWTSMDEVTHQPGMRFNFAVPADMDRKVDMFRMGPDGDTAILSTRLDSDRFQLSAYSLKEGVVKKVLAKHPVYDLSIRDNRHFKMLRSPDSEDFIGLVFEAEKPCVAWMLEPFIGIQKQIEKALSGCACIPVDWSKDAGTFIYFVFSDRRVPCYYLFKPSEGKLMPLFDMNERLKDKQLARMIPFDFKAHDGATLHGYVTYPLDRKDRKVPLVVNVHPGPLGRDYWGMHPDDQYLASRGYAVLRVNYRGSSGFGANYQKAGLGARLDTVIIDDLADGVQDLIAKGTVDPSRVGIMGEGFGGWATYLSLAKYPQLYRAGVAISAISQWKSVQVNPNWLINEDYNSGCWKSLLARPDFAASEKDVDPLARVAEIRQPIYVMHGEKDALVPIASARTMINALRKNQVKLKLKLFPNARHNDWAFDDEVARLNEIGAFFEETLKAPAAGQTQ